MKLSDRIVNFLVQKNAIDAEDSEIYEYGFEVLKENVEITLCILLSGILLRRGWETVVYLIVYCGLRAVSGGYHAETKRKCHIVTAINFFAFLVIETVIAAWEYQVWALVGGYLFCIIIMLCYAPVEHENKPLAEDDRKRNRYSAITVTALLGAGILITYQNLPEVSCGILVTLVEVALLMIIGRRTKNESILYGS